MSQPTDTETKLREALDGVEEGLRLAKVGEYLYNACAYSYGDGRTEPREYGIEWQWQQAKPDEYGQGQLLAASTKWHAEQAADGIGTEATKLRDTIATLRQQVSDAVGALRSMEPHIRTVRGAVRINDEWGRVVQGQTLAAIELSQAFDTLLATLTGGKADA